MSHFGSVYSMDDRGMFMDPIGTGMAPAPSMSFEFDDFGVAPQPLAPQQVAPTSDQVMPISNIKIESTPQVVQLQDLGAQQTQQLQPEQSIDVGNHIIPKLESQDMYIPQYQSEEVSPDVKPDISTGPAKDSPVIDIAINNVVCSFATRCHLNLRRIAMEGKHVILKKECGMVSMKLRKPYTTASIWSSGKITCTGATSEEDSKIAARRFARVLQNLGFKTRIANFRVVNVLGTCSLPFAIDIAEFSRVHPRQASYEPELHPGVTFRITEPKATLKIFSTGSITVTAPRVANVQGAIEYVFPLVYQFQREKKTVAPAVFKETQMYLMPGKKRVAVEKQRQLVMKRQRFDDSDQEDWTDTDGEYDSDDSFE